MNDLDYDAMQKKRIANSARHRVNGSRSKYCSLPSDNLTPAQRKALNGPVTEIRLNEPMDWKTFKGLSDTLKVEYIKHLQEVWKANTAMLGKMFGVTTATVRAAMIDLGLSTKRDRSGGSVGAAFEAKQAAWSAFCNGVVGGGDNQTAEEEKADTEALEADGGVVVQPEKKGWDLDSPDHINARRVPDPVGTEAPESKPHRLDVTFEGWPDELTMTILRNMFRDPRVKVRISAEVIYP